MDKIIACRLSSHATLCGLDRAWGLALFITDELAKRQSYRDPRGGAW
jgi:hypothetical protein